MNEFLSLLKWFCIHHALFKVSKNSTQGKRGNVGEFTQEVVLIS